MYVFYGDESGFSKGGKVEPDQPITVFAGILIDLTKLQKAIRTFDEFLAEINDGLSRPIREIKFSDIKSGAYPYAQKYPTVDNKCDLLHRIVTTFHSEIKYRLLFTAICDSDFFAQKKVGAPHTDRLYHPYLAAAYRVLSRLESENKSKKNNKGNTFVVLDQQSFQKEVENLISEPIHISKFTQIIDTAYFGKSHYSKLIQIVDLLAGIIRYNLFCEHKGKPKKHFDERVAALVPIILEDCVAKECFKDDLKTLYEMIEKK